MPPVVTAIAGALTAIGVGAAAAAWIAGFAVRMVLSIGFSVLARALKKKNQETTQTGIRTSATQTGGTDPQAFVVGLYATGGQLVTPPMTHGKIKKTPNAYLTYVVALSDVPGVALSRLFVDGEPTIIGGPPDPTYGSPVAIRGTWGYAWIRFYDGTQTAPDPMLMSIYGGHPQRPWMADMVGRGTAYAILTFRYERTLYKSLPGVRFEIGGIPLYDPRQDPSVGGAGGQDWNNPATWQRTSNPAVIIYNILRGIAIPGGDTWGGGWAAGDLPVSSWFAAMNTCDQPIPLGTGGTEPRYRAGFEIAVDQEPAEVIAELLKACAGRMADVGGTMKIAVGAPGLPVKGITDDDIIVTDEQTHSLFPSLAQTHNGVHATYPDPMALWENRDAPPRYDAAAEAYDGRRLIATVSLPACPWANQVQRLMYSWVAEERRFRRHQLTLPPDAAILEPHDVISWTSVRNGYSAKLFEVAEIVHDPVSLLQLVSLREVDPADYDWNTTLELPWVAPVPGTSLPVAQTVPDFAVTGTALDDANSLARRPALLLTWDGADQDDVTALQYEVRREGGAQVLSGVATDVASGSQIIAAGMIPSTDYEARAKFVAPRPTAWTAWLSATTPAAYITIGDFDDFTGLFTAAGLSVPAIVDVLPPIDASRYTGEIVFLTTDSKLYRFDGTTWIASTSTSDLVGTITSGLIAAAAVKATHMEIDGILQIDANDAGFSMGKGSSTDYAADGIYMGRMLRPNGQTGYGFLMGSTSPAGIQQYISANNDDGLDIINASFGLWNTVNLGWNAVTAIGTTWLDLVAGVKSFALSMIGGGGGGVADMRYGGTPATGGTWSRVRLFDGAAFTGAEWYSWGGAAGASGLAYGGSSAWGGGGAPGQSGQWNSHENYWYSYPVNAGNGSGWGAGGGAAAAALKGGGAAALVQLSHDVSALSTPRLEITVGYGGSGGIPNNPLNTGLANGGGGSPGRVEIQQFGSVITEAGVVPFRFLTGTFTRPANYAGNSIIPAFGPGLWIIYNATSFLELGMNLTTGGPGEINLDSWNFRELCFVSNGRPTITGSDANTRTYRYIFHGMKV